MVSVLPTRIKKRKKEKRYFYPLPNGSLSANSWLVASGDKGKREKRERGKEKERTLQRKKERKKERTKERKKERKKEKNPAENKT